VDAGEEFACETELVEAEEAVGEDDWVFGRCWRCVLVGGRLYEKRDWGEYHSFL